MVGPSDLEPNDSLTMGLHLMIILCGSKKLGESLEQERILLPR